MLGWGGYVSSRRGWVDISGIIGSGVQGFMLGMSKHVNNGQVKEKGGVDKMTGRTKWRAYKGKGGNR